MATTCSVPLSRCGVSVGTESVFSWKTKAERRATISSGEKSAKTFSRLSAVRTSWSAEWIWGRGFGKSVDEVSFGYKDLPRKLLFL